MSGTYQSLPGVDITAQANLAGVVPVAGLQSVFPTFHIVEPGSVFGERLNQVDLHIGKLFKTGRSRLSVYMDIYNALNTDTITGQDNNYTLVPGGQAIWQVPNLILQARFFKFGASIDF